MKLQTGMYRRPIAHKHSKTKQPAFLAATDLRASKEKEIDLWCGARRGVPWGRTACRAAHCGHVRPSHPLRQLGASDQEQDLGGGRRCLQHGRASGGVGEQHPIRGGDQQQQKVDILAAAATHVEKQSPLLVFLLADLVLPVGYKDQAWPSAGSPELSRPP